MDDDEATKSDTWGRWWADVATSAAENPHKKLPTGTEIAGYFDRFVALCEADAKRVGVAINTKRPDAIAMQIMRHVLDRDPSYGPRYSRRLMRSALAAARQSILPHLTHDNEGLISFPRPFVSEPEIITVVRGKIVPTGSTVSGDHHLRALAEILSPGRPFVFSRCPVCGRIFARSGRSLRCSLSCTQKANDAKRAADPDRIRQSREASQRYREKLRRRAERRMSNRGRER